MVKAIAIIDNNGAIGKDNELLFHLKKDLKQFKQKTLGQVVVMGRKTYESIGKPLPKRYNVIASNSMPYSINTANNLIITKTPLEFINMIDNISREYDIIIIGGEKIYSQTIDMCDEVFLTEVDAEIDGADSFFPLDKLNKNFKVNYYSLPMEEQGYSFKYVKYSKK